ncbi:MAG: STAS domain-containing protein [Rhodobacter sp.]|nr:STAS domain-containing protein [Rhodobacter sp.]MCA3514201.1 STAS domain-containing protein [Rhodobacter sp.]MCA3520273.1 STAS domain-containing protein [Rhodobacter sp.]MCA3523660.1 STAS domain-containing protein [Rhodobacter sp.]MCA3526864.1 STAS domain-containing protein [Rhodobacter sp.]
MQLLAEPRDDILIVRAMDNRIDAAVAIQFKEHMRDLVKAAPPRVMLDLSGVTFLDSSGLGALVAVMKLLGPDRRLELCGLTPAVERVFRLTRMDTVFTVHRTVPGDLRDAV